ncbi:MAG TPA: hypothetical protein VLM85_01050 [Polyangiaceae bacterium]|nr:hypothetical protein [Polyangiaceae bacterium]
MRISLPLLLVLLSVAFFGCGGGGSAFGDGGRPDGGDLDGTLVGDGPGFGFGDSGNGGDGGPCTGLQCQQTCASTSISGKVYDPASVNGLYNVFVYVPNAPLAPITDGPVCTACQAPASGNPIASATTDALGNFTIPNAPVGQNIPLVLQLGKWRRHLTISNVTACVDNPQPDKSLRLPKKQHETSGDDNIPLMAMTTGCDGAECFFLKRIGLDQSEFVGATGSGRVHIYKSSNDEQQTFPGGAGSASTLWNTKTEMMKYDIIFDACECSTYTRGSNGYANMLAYLNAGGRAFATHFFYNFFANQTQCGGDTTCNGVAPLPTVGAWEGNQFLPFANATDCANHGSCLNIDTQIPRGKAFADWYKANNSKIAPTWGNEAYGYCGLTDIREDMGQLNASLVAAGTATPWLYAGDVKSNYDAYYFSFNTPVGTNPAIQCGRAIFSDVHLAEAPSFGGAFPSYCATDPNTGTHAPNELALEFLFFDLSSCVQNDTQPPPPPPN